MADFFGEYMQNQNRNDDDENGKLAKADDPAPVKAKPHVHRRSHATAYKKKTSGRRSTAKK
jgi:hypothetical protein